MLNEVLSEYRPDLTVSRLNRLAARLAGIDSEQRRTALGRSVRLGVVSNYSTQFLVGGLALGLAARGMHADFYEAGYDQWERELLDPGSGLGEFAPDVVFVGLTSMLLGVQRGGTDPGELANHIADLVLAARERLQAQMVVSLAEPLEEESDPSVWSAGWRRALNRVLGERLGATCILLDLEPLIRSAGAGSWYSGRYFATSKLVCHPNQAAAHADYVASFIASAVARPVKLIGVDFDDTLWGGIVGEVGWENVDLDSEGAGLAHLRLQRFLLGLHDDGVLLVGLSKNDFAEAESVFENRPEMILRLDHFAALRIDWNPKSGNLKSALDELNLSASGIAFLDDSPVEREEIRYAFGDAFVPDFPEDPMDLVPSLAASGRFRIARRTAEDAERQEFYKRERERGASRSSSADLSQYYRSLELTLEPQPLESDNQARALDLLAKTNQFNLTTRRHGAQELERIKSVPGGHHRIFRLKDKFGDYGLMGLILALPESEEGLRIESWLLSCRAMGRTVENAMLRHLAEVARESGRRFLVGEYRPTKKNSAVADLYPRLGFTVRGETDGGVLYELEIGGELPANEFVRLLPE
jgi:FkbH-like protein